MEQLLKSTPAMLEFLFYSGDDLADLDADPTVTIVDDRSQTITAGTVAHPATGTYRATIQTPSEVTTLTATWTGLKGGDPVSIVQEYEVVGQFLFALAELSSLAGLETTADARLREARVAVTNLFGDFCGVDFIPRPRHEIRDGTGSTSLWLRRPRATVLRAVTLSGTALTVGGSDLHLYESGKLHRDGGWTRDNRNVEIWYQAGHDHPPPEIRRVAVIAAADQILAETNTISSRAVALANDVGGTTRFAGFRPTGLPAVDGVLKHHVVPRVG